MHKNLLHRSVAPVAIAAGLYVGLIGAAAAATVALVDISGVAVDGAAPTVLVQSVGPGIIDEIYFDFQVEHLGSSWGLDTDISIQAPNGTVFGYDGSFDFGLGIGAGIYSFAGGFAIPDTDAGGDWTFSFSDSFDDFGPDYKFLDGSNISLNSQVDVAVVPLPAGIWLGMTALTGLGVVGRRRRKKKPS